MEFLFLICCPPPPLPGLLWIPRPIKRRISNIRKLTSAHNRPYNRIYVWMNLQPALLTVIFCSTHPYAKKIHQIFPWPLPSLQWPIAFQLWSLMGTATERHKVCAWLRSRANKCIPDHGCPELKYVATKYPTLWSIKYRLLRMRPGSTTAYWTVIIAICKCRTLSGTNISYMWLTCSLSIINICN